MKLNFLTSMFLLLGVAVFISCDKKEDDNNGGLFENYIINYGSYSGAKSTITGINFDSDSTLTDYYEEINDAEGISNIQYAYKYNGNIYFMGNNVDQVFFVDAQSFAQTKNGITDSIVKPRYCVGYGNYLYISCWGGNVWTDVTLSYIAKFNINTNTVEEKIKLEGGPEGLAIANGKLYAALSYKDSIAVMDLSSETFTYIETPAVSTYFAQDNDDNLYVSLISSYTMPSETTGLGFINTTSDELENIYALDGISTSYVKIMAPNSDFSKLYVMSSAYDADWNIVGAINVFNVASKTFESTPFVSNISSMNGVDVYNNKILCFISESTTGGGIAQLYATDGTYEKEYETGIAPFMLLKAE